ncbi:hypothetical protein KL921_001264 [Ogataea angusta]|uniref:Uncharacterized protein n=1 Tax=Pichia angusta TaxID=870730 RepID=A0AAN6DJE0_PICAN|nr:uncharacterized protein KL928_001428 [Ogataea angusta]KAG7813718.1 hypothetical protein KL921_001264 [Ogataea angusta]KAG7821344.1 hypothetical protein KL928_001428 [Ogataea angusta]KAG7825956.1 hypothetical protein KL909_000008 [Ogataea angusta]KAG7832299.1 hypothetical protein KL920_000634 [Ogataea angusta]KAG7836471.1 hypothetical protein KL943_002120 [Ogataea angusta]
MSNNPFTEMLSPSSTGIGNMRNHSQSSLPKPSHQLPGKPHKQVQYDQHSDYYDDHDLPPPYDEVTNKYQKDEYPNDEKMKQSSDSSSSESSPNPFPGSSSAPKQYYKPRREYNGKRLDAEQLTGTVVTKIASDGRVRSKSVGESSRPHRSGEHKSSRGHKERRSHRHHRSKKQTVMDKPKNLDTIDKLDVTGFFSGGGFHHDGPFDACTPHRNKDTKAAPVMAFPVDGPNNSIKGMAPKNNRDQQIDMVFGYNEDEPIYTSKSKNIQVSGKSPYSNGVVVKRASASNSTFLDLKPNPNVVAFDSNVKSAPIHGDTTLGLGSSTFLDGAPAYGVQEKKDGGELGRKKSLVDRLRKKDDETTGLLRRVKSLKVSRR